MTEGARERWWGERSEGRVGERWERARNDGSAEAPKWLGCRGCSDLFGARDGRLRAPCGSCLRRNDGKG